MRKPFSANSPQSESFSEEKWTLGAVSCTAGGMRREAFGVLDAILVCESRLSVVTTDIDESTEARAGGDSRRQPPNTARKTNVGILI
jgi:hypothetical protein